MSRSAPKSIEQAYAARASDLWFEFTGIVVRELADDLEGSRHQRFIVGLASGHTVLIAHNIDLSPRVPIDPGDVVRVQGEYEWNERGGVVHWTHDVPETGQAAGWVEFDGHRYR